MPGGPGGAGQVGVAAAGSSSAYRGKSMTNDDLTELYQHVILDHSRSPRNFHKLENASLRAHGHNPLCGDHYTIYTLMDGDRMKYISFQCASSAISKSNCCIGADVLECKSWDD